MLFRSTIGIIDELASLCTSEKLGGSIPLSTGQTQALVFVEPLGVILGIAPWNAPLILGLRSVAAAVAAGNTAILKVRHSNFCGSLPQPALSNLPSRVLSLVQERITSSLSYFKKPASQSELLTSSHIAPKMLQSVLTLSLITAPSGSATLQALQP